MFIGLLFIGCYFFDPKMHLAEGLESAPPVQSKWNWSLSNISFKNVLASIGPLGLVSTYCIFDEGRKHKKNADHQVQVYGIQTWGYWSLFSVTKQFMKIDIIGLVKIQKQIFFLCDKPPWIDLMWTPENITLDQLQGK